MSRALEAELDRLGKAQSLTAEALPTLKKALATRRSLLIMKAARIVSPPLGKPLAEDLGAAFERMMVDPIKRDGCCHAKIAIMKALERCDIEVPEIFFRGARHIQLEPVWGGREDSAAELRALSAHCLVKMGHYEALNTLARLLADPEPTARLAAARLLAGVPYLGAVPLLRFKLLLPPDDPEILTAACLSLLELDPEGSLDFVVERLEGRDMEVSEAAAFALGESRLPGALLPLSRAWSRSPERAWRRTIFLSIATMRLPAAFDTLLGLIETADPHIADEVCAVLELFVEHDTALQSLLQALLERLDDRARRHALLALLPET